MDNSASEKSFITVVSFWSIYKVPIILGGLSIFCIVLSLVLFIKSYQATEPITFSSTSQSESSVAGTLVEQTITVDVEGAVVRPGVYRLPAGSRVDDAIVTAGGLSEQVDSDAVAKVLNRASKVSDGAKLFIPKKGESISSDNPASRSSSDLGPVGSLGNLVNINFSSQDQLEALSGIGPVTATKIIAGRPYQTLEELVTKKAMSQSLFTKLKSQLSL